MKGKWEPKKLPEFEGNDKVSLVEIITLGLNDMIIGLTVRSHNSAIEYW